jgi:hypothetical protein
MKIENIYVTKMFSVDDRFVFTLETNRYEYESKPVYDASTKFKAEISSPASSEFSNMLIDKMRDRKPITIEVN